jgi:hypothetical protein
MFSVPLLRVAVTLPLPLIVIVSVGAPSVNVVCAWNPEVWPVAVSVNVMEMSCESGENWLFVILPLASAVAYKSGWVSSSGDSTKFRVTVSPGRHPDPVMVTIVPGA